MHVENLKLDEKYVLRSLIRRRVSAVLPKDKTKSMERLPE